MKMTAQQYSVYVEEKTPDSSTSKNLIKSFLMGGFICAFGQAISNLYEYLGAGDELSAGATTITLIFIGALLTGLGIYDKLANIGCAGTLIPITGFANSVVAPAMEFKNEGYVTGTSTKLFVIAGPVLLFGSIAATAYGVIYCLLR